jgi:hypothetical protein
VAPFTAVDLAGSNIVAITVGGPQSVRVRADDNLLSHVTTRVDSGTLEIGETAGRFTTTSAMRVELTVPSLTALTLSGSGVVEANGIRTHSLAVTLSGSGITRASGLVDLLEVTVSGSGDAQLERLVAADARAIVTGSGRIQLTATDGLHASVPGSGVIVYGGDPPKVFSTVTGSGSVVAR